MVLVTFFLALFFHLPPAPHCDAGLWDHVYKPERLKVLDQCVTVTGTIADATASRKTHDKYGVRHESDGDTHGWLTVDPQWRHLLLPGNLSDEGGNLVYEVVCAFPVRQADAKAACRGYHATVQLQPVGTRVAITGTYVQDANHAKWGEQHPVTSITVLR